jgi:hypothetical protein
MAPIQLLCSTSDNANEYHWTRERIYLPPHDKPRLNADGSISQFDVSMPPFVGSVDSEIRYIKEGRGSHRFTEEFLAEWEREDEWTYVEEPKSLTLEEHRNLEGGGVCPRCFVTGLYSLLVRGTVTGIIAQVRKKCLCQITKRVNIRFRNPENVPVRFQGAILRDLKPIPYPDSLLPVARQAEIIALLQANPAQSWLLCGDAGTGKTHFATALYHRALTVAAAADFFGGPSASGAVMRSNTKVLLDAHSTWAGRKANDHSIHPPEFGVNRIKQIAKEGGRPCLFLDELEKVSMTPPKMMTLYELLLAVSEVRGH